MLQSSDETFRLSLLVHTYEHVCKVYCRYMYRLSFKQKKFLNFKTSFTQSQALYISGNIKKNHYRRTVRVPTLNFSEVIVFDELSMWLRNKRNKKFRF